MGCEEIVAFIFIFTIIQAVMAQCRWAAFPATLSNGQFVKPFLKVDFT